MDRISNYNTSGKRDNYPHVGYEQQNQYSGMNNRYYSDNSAPLFLPHLSQMNEKQFGNIPNALDNSNANDTVLLRDIASSRPSSKQKNNNLVEWNPESSTSEREPKSTEEQDSESEEEEDEITTKKRKPRTKLT